MNLAAILKPVRWRTFPRDFLVIQFGFVLFGISIATMIRLNLGTSAWPVLEVALARILHITPGTMTVIMGFMVLSGGLLLREKMGWGTLANILSIGPWEDLFLWLIPPELGSAPLALRVCLLLLAIVTMGLASAIYIGVDAGAGPRDSLMLAIKRKLHWSVRLARGCIELTVVTVGYLLGGPAGVGTLVFALLIGPSVQWGFKLFKVDPHRPAELPADA